MSNKTFALLFFFTLSLALTAQKPLEIILAEQPKAADRRAATILKDYLTDITGQKIEVTATDKVSDKHAPIFIGTHPALKKFDLPTPPEMGEDETFYAAKNNALVLAGGGEMGAEYAVYTFLEKIGCRKYTPAYTFLPRNEKFEIPFLPETHEKPAFPYRELHYQPAFDEAWARWHKLKTKPQKEKEWGMFVHTFRLLCPAEKYFKEHPEWFSWNGSQWSDGQLCLSNDTVLQIVVGALAEKIRQNPDAKYWSVSQNDNFDYCKCARCQKSDAHFGSPAGTLLNFVNKIAINFPEKTISTLAYQYTRKAPKNILPAANVNICLCSIECNRGETLEHDAGSAGFVNDLKAWSALTKNLMMWDYVVQFRSFLSPFPNWHTLQPNLKLFQEQGVQMMFQQGTGRDKSEFSDMRAYFLAKMMWNPQANMDSILLDFGKGYYRTAQPFVWDYIHQMTVNLQKTDKKLLIYGTPFTASESWLTEADVNQYFEIFNGAIEVVEKDSISADRLSEAMLPMLHVLFEQFKFRDWAHPCPDTLPGTFKFCFLPAQWNMVEQFPELCKNFGYEYMNENGYSIKQYAEDLKKFMENGRIMHPFMRNEYLKDRRAVPEITLTEKPSPTYAKGNADVVLDGKLGTTDYNFNWLGFEGTDFQALIKIPDTYAADKLPPVSEISLRFLQDQQSWVFFPEKVIIEISTDGSTFEQVRAENISIEPSGEKSIHQIKVNLSEKKPLRAVRVSAINQKTCPKWHTCNGLKCWIFVDEVVIR